MRWTWLGIVGLTVTLLATPLGTLAQSQSAAIYVVDLFADRIVRMNDMTGDGWATLGTQGDGTNQFHTPTRIHVDASGRIYVVDNNNHRIVRMENITGAAWTTLGSEGGDIRQFSNPDGIFVDAAGRIYVGDTGNRRVVRIDDMTGTGWTFLGTKVGIVCPGNVFVDSVGRIYVLNSCRDLIVRVNDMTGEGLVTFDYGKAPKQFGSVSSMSVDATGRLYLLGYVRGQLDSWISRVDDMTGRGWVRFGRFGIGEGPGEFADPHGIHVDAAGRIYVADSGRSRIVRFNDMMGTGWTTLGGPGLGIKRFVFPTAIFVR